MSNVSESGFWTGNNDVCSFRRKSREDKFEQRQRSYDEAFPACHRLPHEKSWGAYCKHYGWKED